MKSVFKMAQLSLGLWGLSCWFSYSLFNASSCAGIALGRHTQSSRIAFLHNPPMRRA